MNKEQALILQRQLLAELPKEINVILSSWWRHKHDGPDEEDVVVGLWFEGDIMTTIDNKDRDKFKRFCKLMAEEEQIPEMKIIKEVFPEKF